MSSGFVQMGVVDEHASFSTSAKHRSHFEVYLNMKGNRVDSGFKFLSNNRLVYICSQFNDN